MQLYTHLEIDICLRPVRFHPGQAFLEQLCHAIRIKHYSNSSETMYVLIVARICRLAIQLAYLQNHRHQAVHGQSDDQQDHRDVHSSRSQGPEKHGCRQEDNVGDHLELIAHQPVPLPSQVFGLFSIDLRFWLGRRWFFDGCSPSRSAAILIILGSFFRVAQHLKGLIEALHVLVRLRMSGQIGMREQCQTLVCGSNRF